MIETTLRAHLKRYPEMQISDVYKLLHQASIGPTHAISKRESTLEWLEHETELFPVSADALFIESITDDNARVRLHLRPYRAAGGDGGALVDAMLGDGGPDASMVETMAALWREFAAMRHDFPAREVELFGVTYARMSWCAAQHSPEFIAAYHPAYRVLKIETARQLCAAQGIGFEVVS